MKNINIHIMEGSRNAGLHSDPAASQWLLGADLSDPEALTFLPPMVVAASNKIFQDRASAFALAPPYFNELCIGMAEGRGSI